MQEQAVTLIKEVLQKRGIKVLKILLFGSRARRDFHPDSDWDFLVVVENDLNFQEKHDIITEIQRRLAVLRIPNDIVIQSESRFNLMKNYVGNISYYAAREGIEV